MIQIKRLLVANRGEIARRVMRSASNMGIHTVAIYSDGDSNEPFVRDADEGHFIGAGPDRPSSDGDLKDSGKRGAHDQADNVIGFVHEPAVRFCKCCSR